MEICPIEAEMFHVDGWTDIHDEAKSRFLKFFQEPRKGST